VGADSWTWRQKGCRTACSNPEINIFCLQYYHYLDNHVIHVLGQQVFSKKGQQLCWNIKCVPNVWKFREKIRNYHNTMTTFIIMMTYSITSSLQLDNVTMHHYRLEWLHNIAISCTVNLDGPYFSLSNTWSWINNSCCCCSIKWC
jgi:hypothetical protein